MANKSLSNQAASVSNELKTAIEEGNTEKQVKLYENLAEIQQDYSVIKSLDDLQEITTVIPVGNTGRVIVWCI